MHPVIERMQRADAGEREAACREAAEDPSAALLAEALGEALGDPQKSVARAASDALVRIARVDRGVLRVVREALRSTAPRRRFAAAYTSVRLEPPGTHLLPALIESLADRDGDVRWSAARMLVDVGRLHGEVLGVLVGLARAADAPMVRRMAGFCLRELAPDRPESARALVEASCDADLHVRRGALAAMASLLDPPADVARRLLQVLDADADPNSRRIASVALGEIGASCPSALPDGTRERLARWAHAADDENLRRGCERALARLDAATPSRESADIE